MALRLVLRNYVRRWPVYNNKSLPLRVNLAHRCELYILGVMFTTLFTPIQGNTSTLGAKFSPGDKVHTYDF
jgi:hypothetical protein